MAWMMDEYAVMRGYNVPGVITGKPLALGGSAGRGDATAKGGMYTIREAAKILGIDLQRRPSPSRAMATPASSPTQLMAKMFGSKVVAVSDSRGGVYCPEGLDFDAVMAWKDQSTAPSRPTSAALPASRSPTKGCWSWMWTS